MDTKKNLRENKMKKLVLALAALALHLRQAQLRQSAM